MFLSGTVLIFLVLGWPSTSGQIGQRLTALRQGFGILPRFNRPPFRQPPPGFINSQPKQQFLVENGFAPTQFQNNGIQDGNRQPFAFPRQKPSQTLQVDSYLNIPLDQFPDQFASVGSSLPGQVVDVNTNSIPNGVGVPFVANVASFSTIRQIPDAIQDISDIVSPALRLEQEAKKRATLKDILTEDCRDFDRLGYCASPPRYPSHQVNLVTQKCGTILESLYAPLPNDEPLSEPNGNIAGGGMISRRQSGDVTISNKTRNMKRANRQLWSWARYNEKGSGLCSSDRQRINPGYAKDMSDSRWLVVLQSTVHNITQHVPINVCTNPGESCEEAKCLMKKSRCVQKYDYRHLIAWDPDKPDQCPKMKVFKFPTHCICQVTKDAEDSGLDNF